MTDHLSLKPYTHNKTGNRYFVLYEGIDCTNERDGTLVYVYCNEHGQVFVREKHEFLEKFTPA